MKMNFEDRNTFGQEQQTLITPILINHFGNLIELSRYNKFDFVSDDLDIEVKSRMNMSVNTFRETILTCDKVQPKEGKKLFFVFNFVFDVPNDRKQIYFIEYNEEQFETFEVKDVQYPNGGKEPHYYIPVNLLTKIYEDEPLIRRGVCRLKIKK
jgi:hypothetical protein